MAILDSNEPIEDSGGEGDLQESPAQDVDSAISTSLLQIDYAWWMYQEINGLDSWAFAWSPLTLQTIKTFSAIAILGSTYGNGPFLTNIGIINGTALTFLGGYNPYPTFESGPSMSFTGNNWFRPGTWQAVISNGSFYWDDGTNQYTGSLSVAGVLVTNISPTGFSTLPGKPGGGTIDFVVPAGGGFCEFTANWTEFDYQAMDVYFTWLHA